MINQDTFDKIVDSLENNHNNFSLSDASHADNYIDFNLDYVDTFELTKKGYEKYEQLMMTVLILPNVKVYLNNDCSGYDYWTKQQEESNYLHLTIEFKNEATELFDSEKEAIYQFMEAICSKYDAIKEKYIKKGI